MEAPPDTIKHLHALATHPNTPEHERAQAKKILRKLMEKYSISEEELDDTALIERDVVAINKHWQQMIYHLAQEIKDTYEIPGLKMKSHFKRGHSIWVIPFTIVEWADFRAALSWYRVMLDEDIATARRALSGLKKEYKDKLDLAKATVREVHPAFISKYELGKKQLDRYLNDLAEKEVGNTFDEPTEPARPVKKPTQKEINESHKKWRARHAASGILQDGSRWEKPVGNVGGGNKELGNGETFKLSND